MTDSGQPGQPGGSGAGSTVEPSEAMPRGVIHDPGCRCWPHIEASAVDQLKADLEAAQGEIAELRGIGKTFALGDAQFRDRALDVLIRVVGEGDREIHQLRADLAQAQSEIEVEREAGRIQRNKAISNYAEVRRLRNELERATGLQEATLKQLVGSRHGLAQARARITELEKAIRAHVMRRRPGDSEP